MVAEATVRVGECYRDGPAVGVAELVDCSENWEWKISDAFNVELGGSYPGDSYVEAQAGSRCQDWYALPSRVTWISPLQPA